MKKIIVFTVLAAIAVTVSACGDKETSASLGTDYNDETTEMVSELLTEYNSETENIQPADVSAGTESESSSVSENGITEPTYIDGILIANKTYALPSNYAPGTDEEALSAFNEMQKAAYQDGCNIYISSGYRSYERQVEIYNRYVNQDGKEAADTYSSRPGHSEHQTGLTFDLNSIDISFADTPEGAWIAENCYKYGFIIRYPEGKEDITGYMYEPWHIRYLGVEKATEVYESGLCLEEFLGITSSYEDAEKLAQSQ